MAEDRDLIRHTEHLNATAAQKRSQAIQSRLALACTLCAFAESEIRYGRVESARNLIERVQRTADSVRRPGSQVLPGHRALSCYFSD